MMGFDDVSVCMNSVTSLTLMDRPHPLYHARVANNSIAESTFKRPRRNLHGNFVFWLLHR